MENDTKYIVTNCIILFILMIAVAEISYISKNNTIVVNNIHKIQSILVRKLSFWVVASVLLNIVATTRRNASNTRRCNDVSVTRSGNTAIPDTGTVYSSVRHAGPPILLPVFCVHLVLRQQQQQQLIAQQKKEIYIYIYIER